MKVVAIADQVVVTIAVAITVAVTTTVVVTELLVKIKTNYPVAWCYTTLPYKNNFVCSGGSGAGSQ
ncbi:hypothetical protein D3C80_2058700 [compost metagenome]